MDNNRLTPLASSEHEKIETLIKVHQKNIFEQRTTKKKLNEMIVDFPLTQKYSFFLLALVLLYVDQ